jgi:two-component system nitrogen regulation sensor histidine kinase NtrY
MSEIADQPLPIQSSLTLPGRVPPMLGLAVVVTSIVCGLATYFVLTGLAPFQPTPQLISILLALNGILVFAMLAMITWQVAMLWRARRKQIAGARLHGRLVSMFAIVAALPALIVALFATVTLDRGLDTWFSERTQLIVDEAQTVAEAYLREHDQVLRQALATIAFDLSQTGDLLTKDRQLFTRRLANHVAFRGLTAAYVINADKRTVDSSVTANKEVVFIPPPPGSLTTAGAGKGVVINPEDGDTMRGLVKIQNLGDLYLYIYKTVDPQVLQHLKKTREGKAEYDALKAERQGVQFTFALMYIGVAFIFLLAAVWLGLWVADRLVEPIVKMVDAARSVSRGDLDVKVDVRKDQGDIATLGRTFNQMTNQLKEQRDDLVGANELIDERRRFTEAVLSGVTSGVIGVNEDGHINLANRSALKLLNMKSRELQAKGLKSVIPEFAPLLVEAMGKTSGMAEGQVSMPIGDQERNFTIRVTTERSHDDSHGYVVTFDDMTQLVTAQRNSAWADIAQRIAHEIKNPLTPIQLAAERLRRKYSKEITSDPAVFEQCTETIIRQVGDIGRMVDEFSSFARMPKAVLEQNNLTKTVKEALVLQKASTDDYEFDLDVPDVPVELAFDRRLVTQAVTNLVKNAREAIEPMVNNDPDYRGHITVQVKQSADEAIISVADNGIGLPKENRQRLTEPYMTTREKGTGLGLAIVKRIMQEHGGEIRLTDAPDDHKGGAGAQVELIFGKAELQSKPTVKHAEKVKDKSDMGKALADQKS